VEEQARIPGFSPPHRLHLIFEVHSGPIETPKIHERQTVWKKSGIATRQHLNDQTNVAR